MGFPRAISTALFAEMFLPSKEYAMKWRERYDNAMRGCVEARQAGDRARAASLLECANIERRLGWMSATDIQKAFMEGASAGWNWEPLVAKDRPYARVE